MTNTIRLIYFDDLSYVLREGIMPCKELMIDRCFTDSPLYKSIASSDWSKLIASLTLCPPLSLYLYLSIYPSIYVSLPILPVTLERRALVVVTS